MTDKFLKPQTIGKVRSLLNSFTRGTIKQLLLEGGGNLEKILAIPLVDDMKSPRYRTKDAIVSEGFDTIYQDFDRKEADGIVLCLIRVIYDRRPELVTSSGLEGMLAADGFSLSEVLAHVKTETSKLVQEYAESLSLEKAVELQRKVWTRIETDPEGAITSAASALESICKSALEKCGVELPTKMTLPELLTTLRKNTNLDSLFPFGEQSKAVTSSLSGLANNLYLLAHIAGDRHGATEGQPSASRELASLFAGACDVIGAFLLQMLRLQKLQRKNK